MIIERNSDISLYRQLRNALIKKIKEGDYQPGDLLPSEAELIESMAVSRTTVRKAIQSLVQGGYAYTVHGKGTYVGDPHVTQQVNKLTSFSQDIDELGIVSSYRILRLETGEADISLAAKLKIPPSSNVIYIDRLLFAGDEPIALGKARISHPVVAPHADAFTADQLREGGLYDLFNKLGIPLVRGIQNVSATSASEAQAELLQVLPGAPLLYTERLTFTRDDVPLEYVETWSRADKNRLQISLAAFQ